MNGNATDEHIFRVFDLSTDMSAADTERALNDMCGNSLHVAAVAPVPGALRVITKRYKGAATQEAKQAKEAANSEEDGTAVAMLKAHPRLSIRASVSMLGDKGIHRSIGWVHARRRELAAAR